MAEDIFKKVIAHAKEYGFVFQSSEIYDGLSAVYDYGQNGSELKENIKRYWKDSMVKLHENIVGIDSAIFMHPTVWKASGHVGAFNDPLIDNKDSKKRYRADVLIEDHISQHPRVVPTLKNYKGIDIFFDNQPFDLKITYLPRSYDLEEALENPKELIIWLYENQGAQRFGADNRLFVVLASKNNLEESWKLKRDFDFVFSEIDKFLDETTVSTKDEIVFSFNKKTYTAISKILIITK